MNIAIKMKSIGYRVVPELVRYNGKMEIIVEPWDWDKQERRPGRMKRTGIFFKISECRMSGNTKTEFQRKMEEIQLKLIEHITRKRNKTLIQ